MQKSLFHLKKSAEPTVAIIDADLIFRKRYRFPNLECMKLSAYYKQQGYKVELKLDYQGLEAYDIVYVAKVFIDTEIPFEPDDKSRKRGKAINTYYKRNRLLRKNNVRYVGAGFFYDKAPELPDEMYHIMPDYHLYDQYVTMKFEKGASPVEFKYYTDYSIGSITKMVGRKCALYSPLSEFLDTSRPNIYLLDDNIFACRDWKYIFQDIHESGKHFRFKHGIDTKSLTAEKYECLQSTKYLGKQLFTFDDYSDREFIIEKLQMIRNVSRRECRFRLFCGFNRKAPDKYTDKFYYRDLCELFARINILMRYDMYGYVVKYINMPESPYSCIYSCITRWCNQPNMYSKLSFREFLIKDDSRSSLTAYSLIKEKFPILIDQGFLDMKFLSLRKNIYKKRLP